MDHIQRAPRALLLSVLNEALERSGKILQSRFRKVSFSYKGRANLITQADRESQRAILSVLSRRVPEHGYLAEEDARKEGRAGYSWIIDPLDGTTNYAHGYPVACVSIAALSGSAPVAAGIYDPFRDECFLAEAGRGARLNGRPIHVSRAPRLSSSLLLTGFAYDRALRADFYTRFYKRFMTSSHDVRRCGSAALDMAWIADGRADGYWEFKLNPWDVAAGLLIVSEAGGRVSDFSGKPWEDPAKFGLETLATNGRIHREMLKVLRPRGRQSNSGNGRRSAGGR